jgi:hypothetical protein
MAFIEVSIDAIAWMENDLPSGQFHLRLTACAIVVTV